MKTPFTLFFAILMTFSYAQENVGVGTFTPLSTSRINILDTVTSGIRYATYSETNSPGGVGLYGINSVTSIGNNVGIGVQGVASATSVSSMGQSIGVRGQTLGNSSFSFGMYGSAGNNGTGVFGTAGSNGIGVLGSMPGSGTGVRGNSNSGVGVFGQTASFSVGAGEFINTNITGTAVVGRGNNYTGLFLPGDGAGGAFIGTKLGSVFYATNSSGTGIITSGNNGGGQYLLIGSGIAASGSQYGIAAFAFTTVNTNGGNTAGTNGANGSAGGYFQTNSNQTPINFAYVALRDQNNTLRKIVGNGTVNTVVKDTSGNEVLLSCPESPENVFQDYGEGRLVNGKCYVTIDPNFSKNIVVNETHPLRVFIQLEGDCNGVYVTNKSHLGFEVIELKGGTSNIPFSYSITANRADEINPDGTISKYSNERFAPAPGFLPTANARDR